VKAIYSIAFVTAHALTLCNDGATSMAEAITAGLAIGSAVKSNGRRMSAPSQYQLIKSDYGFPWDIKASMRFSSDKTPQALRRTVLLNEAIRVSSVRRRTGIRFATFAIVYINKLLHLVESTGIIREVERQPTRFAKEKERV